MTEILVVKTKVLFPNGIWEGFREAKAEVVLKLVDRQKEYLERSLAEHDESYQQIIPQIVLKVGKKVFIHKIPASGSEGRLHDMWPIFLGGHVEKTDQGIAEASEREFEEEIKYKGRIISKTFLGLVKRHDVSVNKVHLGLVWLFEGDSEEFDMSGDKGVTEGKFVLISELGKYTDKMTYWSQTVVPHLMERFR